MAPCIFLLSHGFDVVYVTVSEDFYSRVSAHHTLVFPLLPVHPVLWVNEKIGMPGWLSTFHAMMLRT